MVEMFEVFGMLFAFAASLLWFKSAAVKVPDRLFEVTFDRTSFERERIWAAEIGRWSKYGALVSGFSAFSFALSFLLERILT